MLTLRECPVFQPFERASLAFAFQLRVLRPDGSEPRSAYRISNIYNAVLGRSPGLEADRRDRAKWLFGASQSFLNDITTGVPGTNGRPLLLAAEALETGAPPAMVTLQRPESWDYEYEGTAVSLQVPPERRELRMAMQDHFCVFESGRIFYLLVLSNLPGERSPLDEYSTIQAEQLAIEPDYAADSDFLSIGRSGPQFSVLEFVRNRLAELDSGKEEPVSECANAIADVLRPFGVLPPGRNFATPRSEDLCNAMVQIEDEALFDTARHAFFHYRMPAPEDVQGPEDEVQKPHPQWVIDADRAWAEANVPGADCHCDAHHTLGFGPDEEESAIPRQLLAFAGLAQGVPDFPRQDDSEIHDSTRPVSVAPENLFFVHPSFELDVGKNWRTLREAQASVGGCPYALLTWMIAVHDELIVSDMERMIERMIFGPVDQDAQLAEIGRATPLKNLAHVLDKVSTLIPSYTKIIDDNLAQRVDIFRWCSIHQSGNVFRYPTERELLGSIREARGTRQRFEDAHALLDRYENLVEDVSTLQASYTSARTNWLLAAITFFGVLGLPGTLSGTFGLTNADALLATVGILAFTAALFTFWLNATQLRRSRKSS
ncbi:hypothetical protein WYH_00751 [Croceibacterium atlanticum]|uniref:CorA-like Mg2+ transporter protein n=2 Tax=Croceibacterium atlanticum TaxID=1267766 RepID=A0A0F7KSS1_9SPHN|nr:hypothetical protein WYH_00751 [Croceibacterium atlanticum]